MTASPIRLANLPKNLSIGVASCLTSLSLGGGVGAVLERCVMYAATPKSATWNAVFADILTEQ